MSRDSTIEAFFESFQAMFRATKSEFHKEMQTPELAPAHVGILFLINRAQPVTNRQLASEMFISRSAVAQLVDGLDQQGLITREDDPNDRRLSYITLSKAGTVLVAKLESKRREMMKRIAGNLTDDELRTMTAINDKIARSFK